MSFDLICRSTLVAVEEGEAASQQAFANNCSSVSFGMNNHKVITGKKERKTQWFIFIVSVLSRCSTGKTASLMYTVSRSRCYHANMLVRYESKSRVHTHMLAMCAQHTHCVCIFSDLPMLRPPPHVQCYFKSQPRFEPQTTRASPCSSSSRPSSWARLHCLKSMSPRLVWWFKHVLLIIRELSHSWCIWTLWEKAKAKHKINNITVWSVLLTCRPPPPPMLNTWDNSKVLF